VLDNEKTLPKGIAVFRDLDGLLKATR
jgi:hypothetical protein